MTKPRPSWSDRQRRAAALIGGLLLCCAVPPSEAAGQKKPLRPATVRKTAGPDLVQAEVRDDALGGLHGQASFYGYGFQGRKTSTGERYDVANFTAASNHFPLGTMVAVLRPDNDMCAVVRINDRMARHRKRVIDVSRGVAEYLDMLSAGVVLVRIAPLKKDWRRHGLGAACRAAFAVPPPDDDDLATIPDPVIPSAVPPLVPPPPRLTP